VTLALGARLGPYEIVSPIGAGGMGEVYRARDTRLDRSVAVKVLPARLSSNPDLRSEVGRHPRVNWCGFADDGRRIVSVSQKFIRMWDAATWSVRCACPTHASVSAVAWSSDGRRLMVGAGTTPQLLVLETMPARAAVATAWLHASRVEMIGPKRAGAPQVPCGACATWFPTQSSSLGGHVACPAGGTTQVLNPFVIEGDWRPIARAWQGLKSGGG
jgi:hypothetical protein